MPYASETASTSFDCVSDSLTTSRTGGPPTGFGGCFGNRCGDTSTRPAAG